MKLMRHVEQLSNFYLSLREYGLTPSETHVVRTRALTTEETSDVNRWMRDYPAPGLWCYQWTRTLKGNKVFYEVVLYMTHEDMAFEAKMKFG